MNVQGITNGRATPARRIGYGMVGFVSSLCALGVGVILLQHFLAVTRMPSESLVLDFVSALIGSLAVLAIFWICLLKGLKNKAIVRGVWYQIYTVIGIAIVALSIFLF
jgi:hypothetical protein